MDIDAIWVRCSRCAVIQSKECSEGETKCFFCEEDLAQITPKFLKEILGCVVEVDGEVCGKEGETRECGLVMCDRHNKMLNFFNTQGKIVGMKEREYPKWNQLCED